MKNKKSDRITGHPVILAVLLAAGAAARIFFAACYRFSPNSDYGIVALMVKHIAEGREFPVFYYGQAYMGSLEPMISAAICRLFGLSEFNLCLGAAVPGILLLPVLYAWGRDAGGRAAGVAALLLAVIGPVAYVRHLAMPWGGYAVVILLGAAIVWLAARLAAREWRRERVSPGRYLLLGLLAGAGWWTSQLIAAALITTALLLAASAGRRLFASWRVPAGLAGFAAGSLPWWIWNFRHGWESFGLAGALGRMSARGGMDLLLRSRLPDLLDLINQPAWLLLAASAGMGVLLSAAAWRLLWRPRGAAPDLQTVSSAAAFLFIAISAGLFCKSHFAAFDTTRYLLPIVPALAVLAGTGAAFLAARAGFWLGWTPLLALVAFQAWNARFAPGMLRDQTWELTGAVFRRELARAGLEAVYCNYADHWLNAATGEAQCFADIVGERYRPYARRAENARRIGFLDNIADVAAFIRDSGGSCRRDNLMRYEIFHDIRPPSVCGRVPDAGWAAATDNRGNDARAAIADGDARTGWAAPVLSGAGPWLEIVFTNPAPVAGLRFVSANGQYPPAWRVEGAVADANAVPGAAREWRALTPLMRINGYFWSGPRLYWNGIGYRAECRFPPAKLSRLRVRFEAPERESEVYVTELDVLGGAAGSAPDAPSECEALNSLLPELQARHIARLYCDRWAANEVAAATRATVWSPREPAIFGRYAGAPRRDRERTPIPVRLDADTAVLVRAEDAPTCRQSLRSRRIEMRETAVGPWVLFDFTPDLWHRRYAADPGLAWTGFNLLKAARARDAEMAREPLE